MAGSKKSTNGAIYALVAAAGLGAVTTQAKIVYEDGGNALTLMLWRFAVSILAIGIIILLRKASFRVERDYRRPTLLLGIVWSGAMICYLMSVQTIPVSLAVLILYSYPVLVLLVSLVTGTIKPSLVLAGMFVLAFAGIALMLGGVDMRFNITGVTFAVLAASGAAFTFIRGSVIAPQMNPVVLAFWVNFSGIFLILPLMYGNFSMPASAIGLACLGGATICYIVAILAQFEALARMPAAKAAFIFNFEPVVSILLALVILGELLTAMQWAGAGIVILVLFLFNWISPGSKTGATERAGVRSGDQ